MGVDKAIAYSSGARVIQGFTGVGSMFFISTFLTGVEQGFYFTFGSILALQVFFELGLTGIMTQYVAHEASHLTLDENGEYQGEERYKSRLASLVHFCVKWYAVLAVLIVVFLNVVGYIYFNKFGDNQGETVEWQTPWILICVATAIQLFVSPLTSILTGLGFVKQTSKISFYQQLITPLCIWIGLVFGMKLYVTGIGYLINVSIWFVLTNKQGLQDVLMKLWQTHVTDRVTYMTEIFPFQWRIALSWVSGYFIFQLFNPVLFATEGAVVAGQMGMTITAMNAILALSASWISTKIPVFSRLIALQDYFNLDIIFNKTLKQMVSICAILLMGFVGVLLLLSVYKISFNEKIFSDRFLGIMPTCLMIIPVLLQSFISSWAVYLRCHKREPYMWYSITNGILCMFSTLIFGKAFGLYGITIGYCTISLIMFPWSYYIYTTNKNKWHQSNIA